MENTAIKIDVSESKFKGDFIITKDSVQHGTRYLTCENTSTGEKYPMKFATLKEGVKKGDYVQEADASFTTFKVKRVIEL